MAGGITQTEYWNGEVGTRWARNQAVLARCSRPLTEALFDRAGLKTGPRCSISAAARGRRPSRPRAGSGPAGRVTGADISAPLLAVARARISGEAPGAAPITFTEADVEQADLGSFDAALSRFGVMFFPDSPRAFANIRGCSGRADS